MRFGFIFIISVIPIWINTEEIIDFPSSYDVREVFPHCNYPIRRQGKCDSSCWAFSTTGPLSFRYCMLFGQNIFLSTQELLDCHRPSPTIQENNCLKALSFLYLYIQRSGVSTEECYPLISNQTGTSYECKPQSDFDFCETENRLLANKFYCKPPKSLAWNNYPEQEIIHKLKTEIYLNGPISARICIKNQIYLYNGTALNYSCQKGSYGHDIALVGWKGDEWVAANSWGTEFGEEGFFRIKMDSHMINLIQFAGVCKMGNYPDRLSRRCIECDPACYDCEGPGSNNCTICKKNQILKPNGFDEKIGVCVACPKWTHFLNKNNLCVPCDPLSANCSFEEGKEVAYRCKNSSHFVMINQTQVLSLSHNTGGKCVKLCGVGHFWLNNYSNGVNYCIPCIPGCKYCSTINKCDVCEKKHVIMINSSENIQNNCTLSCPSQGYTLIENKCLKCHTSCKYCSEGFNINKCTSCPENSILKLKSLGDEEGECIKECPRQSYFIQESSISTNLCVPCHPSCKTCLNEKSGSCTSCYSHFTLQNKSKKKKIGKCISSCSKGSYIDLETKLCVKCPNDCSKCTNQNPENCQPIITSIDFSGRKKFPRNDLTKLKVNAISHNPTSLEVEYFIFPEIPFISYDRYFHIDGNYFNSQPYNLTVSVSDSWGSSNKFVSIVSSKGVTASRLIILPKKGTAFSTEFSIELINPTSEGSPSSLLTYEAKFKRIGEKKEHHLGTYDNRKFKLLLPQGNPNEKNQLQIIVEITNQYHEYFKISQNVSVLPSSQAEIEQKLFSTIFDEFETPAKKLKDIYLFLYHMQQTNDYYLKKEWPEEWLFIIDEYEKILADLIVWEDHVEFELALDILELLQVQSYIFERCWFKLSNEIETLMNKKYAFQDKYEISTFTPRFISSIRQLINLSSFITYSTIGFEYLKKIKKSLNFLSLGLLLNPLDYKSELSIQNISVYAEKITEGQNGLIYLPNLMNLSYYIANGKENATTRFQKKEFLLSIVLIQNIEHTSFYDKIVAISFGLYSTKNARIKESIFQFQFKFNSHYQFAYSYNHSKWNPEIITNFENETSKYTNYHKAPEEFLILSPSPRKAEPNYNSNSIDTIWGLKTFMFGLLLYPLALILFGHKIKYKSESKYQSIHLPRFSLCDSFENGYFYIVLIKNWRRYHLFHYPSFLLLTYKILLFFHVSFSFQVNI